MPRATTPSAAVAWARDAQIDICEPTWMHSLTFEDAEDKKHTRSSTTAQLSNQQLFLHSNNVTGIFQTDCRLDNLDEGQQP